MKSRREDPQAKRDTERVYPRVGGTRRSESRGKGEGVRLRPSIPTEIGCFKIVRLIGEGGFGQVYLARDSFVGREVALKILSKELSSDQGFVKRFQREARSASRISHHNVVSVYAAGEADGFHYLAMEFVDGVQLDDFFLSDRAVDEDKLLIIMKEIAEGLAEAHENGVVHRDLKPQNIMIEKGTDRVVILDFGLARPLEPGSELTRSGLMAGTPWYMSPEQAQMSVEKVDRRTDMYSLSVVAYELATGQLPFDADTPLGVLKKVIDEDPIRPRNLRSTISKGLEAIILKGMEKEKENRYQTAPELIEDIEACMGGQPPKAKKYTVVRQGRRWLEKRRKLAVVAGGTSLTIAFGIGILSEIRMREHRRMTREAEALILAEKEKAREIRLQVGRTLQELGIFEPEADAEEIGTRPADQGAIRNRPAILAAPPAPEAVPQLVELLGDDYWGFRQEAAQQLLSIGRDCVPDLIEALRGDKGPARSMAAYLLGRLDAREAIPDLETLIAEKECSRDAAEALVRMNAKESLSTVMGLLDHSDSACRARAAWILGEIGDITAVAALRGLLSDRESFCRSSAAEALQKLEKKPGMSEAINAKVALLLDLRVGPYLKAKEGILANCSGQVEVFDLDRSRTHGNDPVADIRALDPRIIVAVGPGGTDLAAERFPDRPLVYCLDVREKEQIGSREDILGVPLRTDALAQLSAIRELLPELETIGIPYRDVQMEEVIERAKSVAEGLGLTLVPKKVGQDEGIDNDLSVLLGQVEAIWVLPDRALLQDGSGRTLITESLEAKVPLLAYSQGFARRGALLAVTPDFGDIGRNTATRANHLLMGTEVDESENDFPKSIWTINMQVARLLHIDVPVEVQKKAALLVN